MLKALKINSASYSTYETLAKAANRPVEPLQRVNNTYVVHNTSQPNSLFWVTPEDWELNYSWVSRPNTKKLVEVRRIDIDPDRY